MALNPENVPASLRKLIPLAEKFGISDDLDREILVRASSAHDIELLKKAIIDHDDELDLWLVGEEASSSNPSDEYVAFSAMRMAADYA
jgi:hypothetical protein